MMFNGWNKGAPLDGSMDFHPPEAPCFALCNTPGSRKDLADKTERKVRKLVWKMSSSSATMVSMANPL